MRPLPRRGSDVLHRRAAPGGLQAHSVQGRNRPPRRRLGWWRHDEGPRAMGLHLQALWWRSPIAGLAAAWPLQLGVHPPTRVALGLSDAANTHEAAHVASSARVVARPLPEVGCSPLLGRQRIPGRRPCTRAAAHIPPALRAPGVAGEVVVGTAHGGHGIARPHTHRQAVRAQLREPCGARSHCQGIRPPLEAGPGPALP
mmetsp:Transcript_19478/g.43794  ORF Transcript_19478/g.43794 Transcript_19478/m.43794 type:complete len:200 (-) Transcript_19478:91-690(-)